jgi:hypothetical protein
VEQLGGQAVVAEQGVELGPHQQPRPHAITAPGACRATAGAEVDEPGGTPFAQLQADLTAPVVVAGVGEAVAVGAVGGPGRVAVSSTAKSTAVCSP